MSTKNLCNGGSLYAPRHGDLTSNIYAKVPNSKKFDEKHTCIFHAWCSCAEGKVTANNATLTAVRNDTFRLSVTIAREHS